MEDPDSLDIGVILKRREYYSKFLFFELLIYNVNNSKNHIILNLESIYLYKAIEKSPQ